MYGAKSILIRVKNPNIEFGGKIEIAYLIAPINNHVSLLESQFNPI